jgi:hypothetical protein
MIPLKRAETIVGRTNENFRRTLFARWEKAMDQDSFVDSLISEIVKPGLHSLMQTQYFSELRQGTLSIRRLQGFSLQHYISNVALNKGFALCMVKYAHDVELYKHFAYQIPFFPLLQRGELRWEVERKNPNQRFERTLLSVPPLWKRGVGEIFG